MVSEALVAINDARMLPKAALLCASPCAWPFLFISMYRLFPFVATRECDNIPAAARVPWIVTDVAFCLPSYLPAGLLHTFLCVSLRTFLCAFLCSFLLPTVCGFLRVISFLATSLPGPHFHCRVGQPTATLDWPDHWWQVLLPNVGRQVRYCSG